MGISIRTKGVYLLQRLLKNTKMGLYNYLDYRYDYSDYDYSDFDFSDYDFDFSDESDSEDQIEEAQELVDFLEQIETQVEEDGAICAKVKATASKYKEHAMAKAAELKKTAMELVKKKAMEVAAKHAHSAIEAAHAHAKAAITTITRDEEATE